MDDVKSNVDEKQQKLVYLMYKLRKGVILEMQQEDDGKIMVTIREDGEAVGGLGWLSRFKVDNVGAINIYGGTLEKELYDE